MSEQSETKYVEPHLAWVHMGAGLPYSMLLQYDAEGRPAYLRWGDQLFALQPTDITLGELNEVHKKDRRLLLNFWNGARYAVGGTWEFPDRREYHGHIVTAVIDINNPVIEAQPANPPDDHEQAKEYERARRASRKRKPAGGPHDAA